MGRFLLPHPTMVDYTLHCDGNPELLFTENESNASRLWGAANSSPYVKDAFHEYVVAGNKDAVNPDHVGTKAAAHYVLQVAGGGKAQVRLRIGSVPQIEAFSKFDQLITARVSDADEFYERITPRSLSEDERRVHRQALAGMLWSKQFYYFDLDRWLAEHEPIR